MAGWQQKDTHHTVSAGVIEALGKGLLIATGGLIAGITFGTTNITDLSLWAVGVAAVSGVACMVSSALLRNAGFDGGGQDADRPSPAPGAGKGIEATPVVEAAAEVEECRARQRLAASRERGHGTGRCV